MKLPKTPIVPKVDLLPHIVDIVVTCHLVRLPSLVPKVCIADLKVRFERLRE